ncbi:MAG TPA: hypothetical protein VH914_02555 [Acidimicrobiia bacterium]|jgi:amino acid transporter|nr:hypothetical protein [Acidimicrobiia bacterium]
MSENPTDDSVTSSARLAQFQEEVARLKLKGGGANPERNGANTGIGLAIVGVIIVVIAWLSSKGAGGSVNARLDAQVAAIIGLLVGIVGLVVWLRNSITSYLRYWLIRLIYEDREQTERLIQAIEKLADK